MRYVVPLLWQLVVWTLRIGWYVLLASGAILLVTLIVMAAARASGA